MDISAIFKRAWEITWKHKGLWLLGILANCSSGSSQYSSNAGSVPQYTVGGGEFPQIDHWLQSVPEEIWIAIAIAVAIADITYPIAVEVKLVRVRNIRAVVILVGHSVVVVIWIASIPGAIFVVIGRSSLLTSEQLSQASPKVSPSALA